DYNNFTNYSGTPFTLSNGQQTVTGASVNIMADPTFGQIYRVTRSNLQNVRNTRQDYVSFFAQDTWRFHRFTFRPGVRYEQQKLVGNLANYTFDGNWAPRLGVTFDPTGQGRMKLFANYGRFFAKIPNDLAARALSADAGVSRADYFDPNLTQPIAEGVTAGGTTRHLILAGLSPSTFDANARSTYSNEIVAGVEWEAVRGLSLAARYTTRNYGRVLEDVGTAPMIAYFLLPSAELSSVEYFITNPGNQTPVSFGTDFSDAPITFEDAVHDYKAVEFEAQKRFSNNWSLQASYRYSRTTGNFEGFFRNDNGQSDPGITSLFDFPTNDPTYATLGREEGFRGDIRYLGTAGIGPLPNDRRHQGKVFGNYLFGFGVNLGVGVNLSSGRPLTALAANPVYDSPGEIPETPRGAGFQTEQGFKKRTPMENEIDLHADYNWRLFGARRLTLLADVFNLGGTQGVRDYDDFTETSFAAENPDFGRILAYQTPRTFRFGVRVQF
ncbi:MAG TPA: TonB-dependent receptor, partial [Gemmataceae bacterium]|nr:TonB-dependent receptor [Gemmataceae bacterium]